MDTLVGAMDSFAKSTKIVCGDIVPVESQIQNLQVTHVRGCCL